MKNSIHHSKRLYNYLKKLSLCRVFPQTAMKHIMAILISVFSFGYHGKTINFEKYSPCHRTTVVHFLNKGNWEGRQGYYFLCDRRYTCGDIMDAIIKKIAVPCYMNR